MVYAASSYVPATPVPAAVPQLELPMVQMLCSRLCHDLAGPVGAVGAGIDMLRDGAGDDAEARELVAFGARQLAARLDFYRIAFGFGGAAQHFSWAGVRTLTQRLFEGGRVMAEFKTPAADGGGEVAPDVFRLALLLILLGAEALPRGGGIAVVASGARPGSTLPGLTLSVRASGDKAALAEASVAALSGNDDGGTPSRAVTAVYAARLAQSLGVGIRVRTEAGAITLSVSLPAAA
jgi:histidine phosphotransferase ChpT